MRCSHSRNSSAKRFRIHFSLRQIQMHFLPWMRRLESSLPLR
jgi:hypothetical protein